MPQTLEQCTCGSGKEAVAIYDGYGIFMCYVCTDCKEKKIASFRPDIFTRYPTDEQIEDDY